MISLKESINDALPVGTQRDDALDRIAGLEHPPDPDDDKQESLWTAMVNPELTRAGYLAVLATTLQARFCDANGSPEAFAGVIAQLGPGFVDAPAQCAKLAEAFLDRTKCAASGGITEESREQLRLILDYFQ